MSPPNINFWSISCKESLESQQKHALRNRLLRTLLCSNVIFIPDTIGKHYLERENPFLTEFVLIMNSCLIQYNAPLVENINVAQEVNALSKKLFVFSQL